MLLDNRPFSFDNISYNEFLHAVPSKRFLNSIKNVGKREDNRGLDFNWIKSFVSGKHEK